MPAARDPFRPRPWRLAGSVTLQTGPRSLVMGILNVTPDSFSDGGLHSGVADAVAHAVRMIEEGADIIDIGGESTRPGAEEIDEETEQARILPVIRELSARAIPVSVDTWRASTARLALEAGANAINEIWGLQKDPQIAHVAARAGAGVVAMHNSRERVCESDAIADQRLFLSRTLEIAREAGIGADALMLDPGLGFGKEADENLELLARLGELHEFDLPLLIGASRKRFIGAVTGREAKDRAVGTAATNVVARMQGAAAFRVHDVAVNREALAIADAILARRSGRGGAS
jgi:dihydropteroate synthase